MNTKLMIASRTSEPPVHARSAATCSVDLTRLDFSNNYPTMFDSLALFGKSLDARISYEGKMTDAMKQCEQDVRLARERLARDEYRLQCEYEDDMQRAYEAHGDAPPPPRDDPSTYFRKQLAKVQRQQVGLHDRIVTLEQQSVSPRTTQRLQDTYDTGIDERINLVRNLDTPPVTPMGLRGADGPLSQCKRVLFQDEVELEPEEGAPDPQLAAVGGSGGVSSVDGA
jgi:hypothetical protein